MSNIMVTDTKITYLDKLKRWNSLTRHKTQLEKSIDNQEKILRDLFDRLTPASIESKLVITYDIHITMPRGTDVSDPTGNLVTDIYQKREDAEQRLKQTRLKLAEVCRQLQEIEDAVFRLADRYSVILEMRYKDWCDWESIASSMCISVGRAKQMRKEALEGLEHEWFR